MSSTAATPDSDRPRHLRDWDDLAAQRPLPVRFALFPSRRVDRALCPALVLRTDGVEVIRILDPEHKQPFFTLDSVFLLAGLTPIAGLMRFKLRRERGDYDVTLAGLEPREALWSPWSTAYAVAEELGLFPALQTLFTCKPAWSLDERGEGFTHNWCVSSEQINPSTYSLTALLEKPFSTITLLPRRQQIRTLISSEQRNQATEAAAPVSLQLGCPPDDNRQKVWQRRVRLEQSLSRWTVRAYEQWVEQDPAVWTPHFVDTLLFLHTLLPGEGQQLTMSTGQEHTTVEELKSWSLQRQSQPAEREPEHDADDEVGASARQGPLVEQEARACLHLIDHLSRLYLDRAVLCARQQLTEERLDSSSRQAAAADGLGSTTSHNSIDPQKYQQPPSDINVHLTRLIASAKRTEEAIHALTRQDQRSKRGKPGISLDSFGQQYIPWHFLPALLLGIALGGMLTRQ